MRHTQARPSRGSRRTRPRLWAWCEGRRVSARPTSIRRPTTSTSPPARCSMACPSFPRTCSRGRWRRASRTSSRPRGPGSRMRLARARGASWMLRDPSRRSRSPPGCRPTPSPWSTPRAGSSGTRTNSSARAWSGTPSPVAPGAATGRRWRKPSWRANSRWPRPRCWPGSWTAATRAVWVRRRTQRSCGRRGQRRPATLASRARPTMPSSGRRRRLSCSACSRGSRVSASTPIRRRRNLPSRRATAWPGLAVRRSPAR